MTAIRYDVVVVRMNELHSQRKTVPTWETPVLIAVHSPSDVTTESQVTLEVDLPDAGAEYQRLFNRYGADVEQGGVPFVAQVYGQQGVGLAHLEESIRNAVVSAPRAPKKEIA